MELMLRRELRRWQKRTGGTTHLFRPNRQIAALARHPLNLFDRARARAAYPMGYEQAATRLRSLPDLVRLRSAAPEHEPAGPRPRVDLGGHAGTGSTRLTTAAGR